MLTKTCYRSLLALILALSGVSPANAQVGTRASGMAGAYVGVADDATAVYWNPAGVATGALVSVVIGGGGQSIVRGGQLEKPQQDTAAVVAISATAVGLAYYRLGTYGRSASDPAVSSPSSREEVRRSVQGISTSTVGVSLVQSLGQFVVVGVTPKYMNGSSDGASGHAFDADAGVMVAINHIRLGLVARNLTTPSFTVGGGEEVALDREVRIGGAWGSGWTGVSRVIASVDGDLMSRPTPSGDRRDVAAGVETWWMGQRLGVRGGARRSTIGDARTAFAAGISAGLSPGMLLEAHVVRGHAAEHSWSVGARMLF
jgi:hypothetical protein